MWGMSLEPLMTFNINLHKTQQPQLNSPAHHEELAQGDVRENVVGFVFATGDPTLLPEVRELVLQRSAGAQVEDKLPGQRVVQEGVVHMGEQPGE